MAAPQETTTASPLQVSQARTFNPKHMYSRAICWSVCLSISTVIIDEVMSLTGSGEGRRKGLGISRRDKK